MTKIHFLVEKSTHRLFYYDHFIIDKFLCHYNYYRDVFIDYSCIHDKIPIPEDTDLVIHLVSNDSVNGFELYGICNPDMDKLMGNDYTSLNPIYYGDVMSNKGIGDKLFLQLNYNNKGILGKDNIFLKLESLKFLFSRISMFFGLELDGNGIHNVIVSGVEGRETALKVSRLVMENFKGVKVYLNNTAEIPKHKQEDYDIMIEEYIDYEVDVRVRDILEKYEIKYEKE